MRVHGAGRSVLLLACTGLLAGVASGPGGPLLAAARASHAQRSSQPRPTPAPATPVGVPALPASVPPAAATPRSHPSHGAFAPPTADPGTPASSVPTAIAVPVGPPSAPVVPAGRITGGLPVIPTLPALTLPESPGPTPGASLPEPPASPARVPAAATVTGGVQDPGPLVLAGVALAAGFIGATSLVGRRRAALTGSGSTGPGAEPPGR